MKQWTVYFRDKNGSKASVVIEAEDRSGVFAELKKRGISAISVTEGASNKKPRKAEKKAGSPSKGRGLLAAAIVVLGAGLAVWWMMKGEEKGDLSVESSPKKVVSKHTKGSVSINQSRVDEKVELKKTSEEMLMEGLDTNKWKFVRNPVTGEEYISRILRPTEFIENKRLYTNQALNEIDAIMFGDMSDPLVGVSIDSRFMDQLAKAFVNGVEEKAEDSEEVVARKEEMKSTLAMLKNALKNGEDVASIVEVALREHRKVAAFKDQMREERRIMRDSGASEQEIEEFEDACNKKLEEFGSSPMLTRRLAEEKIKAIRNKKNERK